MNKLGLASGFKAEQLALSNFANCSSGTGSASGRRACLVVLVDDFTGA